MAPLVSTRPSRPRPWGQRAVLGVVLGSIVLGGCFTMASNSVMDAPGGEAPAGSERLPRLRREPSPSVEPSVPRLITTAGSGIDMVWSDGIADVLPIRGRLLVLEEDFLHVSAFDLRTGEALWRVQVQSQAWGFHAFYRVDDQAMLHAGNRLLVIEPERGRQLAQHEVPAGGVDRLNHQLVYTAGACALVSSCSLLPIQCDDGSAVGSLLASSELRLDLEPLEPDDAVEHETICPVTPQLVGRGPDTLVVIVEDPASSGSLADTEPQAMLLGLDAQSGQQRWQVSLLGSFPRAGLSPDGRSCWTLEDPTKPLQVRDCSTGALRWEKPLPLGQINIYTPNDQTLVVERVHEGHVELLGLELEDGGRRWRQRLPRRWLPLLPEFLVPNSASTGRRVYVPIDPQVGYRRGQIAVSRGERLWRDPVGGFVRTGRELVEFDDQAALRRQRPFTGGTVAHVTATHLLVRDGSDLLFFDREQLRERARLEGGFAVQADEALPDDRLLLRRMDEQGQGAVLLGLGAPERRR